MSTATPAAASTTADFSIVLVLAVLTAIAIRVFWKTIISVILISGLALIFAGVFGSIWMITSRR